MFLISGLVNDFAGGVAGFFDYDLAFGGSFHFHALDVVVAGVGFFGSSNCVFDAGNSAFVKEEIAIGCVVAHEVEDIEVEIGIDKFEVGNDINIKCFFVGILVDTHFRIVCSHNGENRTASSLVVRSEHKVVVVNFLCRRAEVGRLEAFRVKGNEGVVFHFEVGHQRIAEGADTADKADIGIGIIVVLNNGENIHTELLSLATLLLGGEQECAVGFGEERLNEDAIVACMLAVVFNGNRQITVGYKPALALS